MGQVKTQPSQVCQQHVAIEVCDMDESIAFYRNIFGMKLTELHRAGEVAAIPVDLAFLRVSDHHHDLNLVHNPNKKYKKKDAEAPEVNIHHLAFEYPDHESWLQQLEHVKANNVEIVRGPVLHSPYQPGGEGSWGESESFYVEDPNGHRVECFWNMVRIDEEGRYRFPKTGEIVHERAKADEV